MLIAYYVKRVLKILIHQMNIYLGINTLNRIKYMITSEFVKSIGNAEKENDNDLTSKSYNLALNNNLTFDINLINNNNNERK